MDDTRVKGWLRTCASLRAQRDKWSGDWDILRDLLIPRRNADADEYSHCPEGSKCCMRLAAGFMEYITPSRRPWFAFQHDAVDSKDDVKAWCGDVTRIVQESIANSNFYTEIHEANLDDCSLGTGCMYCPDWENGGLTFTQVPCGTFGVAEDKDKRINTLARWFKFSAVQAMEKFGRNGKIACEKIQAAYEDAGKKYDPDFTIVHLVQPRKVYDLRLAEYDGKQRPFESIYICEESETLLQEDGYHEFPYFVPRFLKWGNGPYGLAPGKAVIPAMKSLIRLNENMDTLADIAAFPRILELANQVGEVDFRAGGRTTISREAADKNFPREWASGGSYDVGQDRIEIKKREIQEAFYCDMLQVISQIDREMTATEVRAREGEKLTMFSPTFTLYTSDLSYFFKRIFGVLARADKFPPPPPSLMKENAITKELMMALPTVRFTGKLAIALEQIQTESSMMALQPLTDASAAWPELLDIVKVRDLFKDYLRTSGMKEEHITTDQELKVIDKAKQEALKAQEELAAMQGGAAAAKDGATALSLLKNESRK